MSNKNLLEIKERLIKVYFAKIEWWKNGDDKNRFEEIETLKEKIAGLREEVSKINPPLYAPPN